MPVENEPHDNADHEAPVDYPMGKTVAVVSEHDHISVHVCFEDGRTVAALLDVRAATIVGVALIKAAMMTEVGMGRPPAGEKH